MADSKALVLPPKPHPEVGENLMYKKRVQEYVARFHLPQPVYFVVNEEGFSNAQNFRSTVLVDGAHYASQSTFGHRKEADQDAARVAMLAIERKVKDEGLAFIRQGAMFCKALLHEYTMKMKLDKPTYNTHRPEGLISAFMTSLDFNGATFTGEAAKSKKEAEQLAARAAILSLLDSENNFTISMMIKDKAKQFSVFNEVKVEDNTQNGSVVGLETHQQYNMPISAIPEAHPTTMPPPIPHSVHEFKKPASEGPPAPSQPITPIVFVPPASEQPLGFPSISAKKRNRKNNKKAKKKSRVDDQSPVVVPMNQCSVAQ